MQRIEFFCLVLDVCGEKPILHREGKIRCEKIRKVHAGTILQGKSYQNQLILFLSGLTHKIDNYMNEPKIFWTDVFPAKIMPKIQDNKISWISQSKLPHFF